MKITDYGFWFKDWHTDEFKKIPSDEMYLNRVYIGCSLISHFVAYPEPLNEIGFKINPKSPGEKYGLWWHFPKGYIPSESDFEEIP